MNDFHTNAPTALRPTNTMGLVGFIVSLASLVVCLGVLSPVSLIFSLIGLGREPKGFAIAGLVLSVIGLLWFGALFVFGGVAIVVGMLGLGILVAMVAVVGALGQNAFLVADAVHDHYEEHGVVPATLDDLGLDRSTTLDPWGNEYVYVAGPNGTSFMLISAGPDQMLATRDDLLGEVDLAGGDVDAELHRGYGGVDRSKWGGLPEPTEAPAEPVDQDAG